MSQMAKVRVASSDWSRDIDITFLKEYSDNIIQELGLHIMENRLAFRFCYFS